MSYAGIGRDANTDLFIENFKKAVSSDNRYAPAWYELYNYSRYTDPATAMTYFKEYTNHSDKTIEQDYGYTDLLYLNKDYANAIQHANALIKSEGEKVQPRIHKLIAYSLAGMKDSINAIAHMQDYFRSESDSNIIVKDYELMADLFSSQAGKEDSVMNYYSKAAEKTDDSLARRYYFKELARLSNLRKDYSSEAMWRGKFYDNNSQAKNIDLFNWGLAYYKASDFKTTDSIFGMYTEKYPEDIFGYYWRAQATAAIDSTMKDSLAIPHYRKVIELGEKDKVAHKKMLLKAYGYMGGYEANVTKDYAASLDYFEKYSALEENADVTKYIETLRKWKPS